MNVVCYCDAGVVCRCVVYYVFYYVDDGAGYVVRYCACVVVYVVGAVCVGSVAVGCGFDDFDILYALCVYRALSVVRTSMMLIVCGVDDVATICVRDVGWFAIAVSVFIFADIVVVVARGVVGSTADDGCVGVVDGIVCLRVLVCCVAIVFLLLQHVWCYC